MTSNLDFILTVSNARHSSPVALFETLISCINHIYHVRLTWMTMKPCWRQSNARSDKECSTPALLNGQHQRCNCPTEHQSIGLNGRWTKNCCSSLKKFAPWIRLLSYQVCFGHTAVWWERRNATDISLTAHVESTLLGQVLIKHIAFPQLGKKARCLILRLWGSGLSSQSQNQRQWQRQRRGFYSSS